MVFLARVHAGLGIIIASASRQLHGLLPRACVILSFKNIARVVYNNRGIRE